MEKTITIDIGRIFKAIFRKWWLIIIVAIIFFAGAFVYTDSRQDVYRSTTSVFSVSYGSYSESMEANKILQSYGEIANSRKVAERAAFLLNDSRITAGDILSSSRILISEDSAIIRISAYSTDPFLAVEIANAVAQAFTIEAKGTFGIDTLKVLDEAQSASLYQGKDQMKYSVIAFLAGLFIPMVVIAIRVIVSDDVYYVSDAELDGKLEILGIIPEQK